MRKLLSFGVVSLFAVASAAPVEWTFPRNGCHEGIPFSDTVTGVLVWGGGDTVNLTLGRSELWDHRGGYTWLAEQSYTNIVSLVRKGNLDALKAIFRKETKPDEPRNPRMIMFTRMILTVKGCELKRGELDPMTGLGRIVFLGADGKEFEVPMAMSMTDRTFAMKFPESVQVDVRLRPGMYAYKWITSQLRAHGFGDPAEWRDGGQGGFTWTLPADKPISLGYALSKGELAIRAERIGEPLRVRADYAKTAAASRAYWARFWEKGARVRVPDPKIQEIYDFGMYKFGSMTDPGGVPPGLQGAWLEDHGFVPWNGDYHFNINVQECYAPAYRSGHVENLMPLFRMVRTWWPRLRENARMFCGVEDGFVLPHSVDDRGTCIGGFWSGTIDHGSTAWVASMMFRYVRYARDLAFLKSDAYPFMKGAMNVYRAMMEERDGKLSLPVMPSPEMGGKDPRSCVGTNPSFQLAAAHRLARDLLEAAKMLGETPDPMWLDVEERLPQYAVVGNRIGVWEKYDLNESHRHHSHLAGFYPFDTIDLAKDRTLVEETYQKWVRCGTGTWSGWAFPWASILHTHIGDADAAVWMLRTWDAFFCNPGHGSRHDCYAPGVSIMRRGPNAKAYGVCGDREQNEEIMQMDGQCAATAAVLELMAHDVNGKTEFFRGCPASWTDVSFENILLSDGTRVSGRRLNGKVEITRK